MKINYFNFKPWKERYLITNEQGAYSFVDAKDLMALIYGKYSEINSEKLMELEQKLFVFSDDEDVFVEKAMIPYRSMKQYLFSATCLHILVMTNACNMCCVYCQAQDSGRVIKGMMSIEIAERAVDIALQSPEREITFEFQGGEPLTNFGCIKHVVEYAEGRKNDKKINYTIVTNTLLLTNEMVDFFVRYKVAVSTSVDGDMELHDSNRPQKNGRGTFGIVCENIRRMRQAGIGVGAIQTTTRKSLSHSKEIVETYQSMDLGYLFIRPLTPLGYAREHWEEIGYTAEEFISFYKDALMHIIEVNRRGLSMIEGHAVIFLRKILNRCADNYMELRSPCGAVIGQMAYYYDGKIYTCDEGRMLSEMGMPDFCLGDVFKSNYDSLMESSVCKVTCQASVLETIPGCCECVYHPYCGVCPVVNYALDQNIYTREANGYRCKIYKGILDTIFEFLDDENSDVMEIFKSWL